MTVGGGGMTVGGVGMTVGGMDSGLRRNDGLGGCGMAVHRGMRFDTGGGMGYTGWRPCAGLLSGRQSGARRELARGKDSSYGF